MKRETVYDLFSHIPALETPRLLLRRIAVGDAADMFDYARREEVTRYLMWNPHTDIRMTTDYLRYLQQRSRIGDFYDWAVVERQSGRMIGTCGFSRFDFNHDVGEIGYVINPDFQGKGYATEAVERVIAFGFAQLPLHRIEAVFIEGNERSRRVMENVGMTFEGYRREGMLIKRAYRTVGVCSILRDEAMGPSIETD